MITKIGMAYEARNFFGEYEQRYDERSFNITREHVLKAIKYIAGHRYGFPCAHLDVDGGAYNGGTHEVIYQDGEQYGTDAYTWEHRVRPNAKDVYEIDYKELLKVSRGWMEEPEHCVE